MVIGCFCFNLLSPRFRYVLFLKLVAMHVSAAKQREMQVCRKEKNVKFVFKSNFVLFLDISYFSVLLQVYLKYNSLPVFSPLIIFKFSIAWWKSAAHCTIEYITELKQRRFWVMHEPEVAFLQRVPFWPHFQANCLHKRKGTEEFNFCRLKAY